MSPSPSEQGPIPGEASFKSRAAHEHSSPSENDSLPGFQTPSSAAGNDQPPNAVTRRLLSLFNSSPSDTAPLATQEQTQEGAVADAPASAGAPPRPLPCLKSVNCNDTGHEQEANERLQDRIRYQLKAGVTLELNAGAFIKRFGLERVGFLTLTLADHLDWRNETEWQEAQRRFRSLDTGYLHKRFTARMCVLEPQQKNGMCIHWHLLVNTGTDIRTGFDFDAVKRRDYRSANPALKTIWRELRHTLPGYGFGRSEMMPLRREGEAVAKYLGKYLSKEGWRFALLQEFKARRVRYSRGWTVANMRWSWNSEGGRKWRTALRLVAGAVDCENLGQFQEWAIFLFGPKWAYHLRRRICELGELLANGDTVPKFQHKGPNFIVRNKRAIARLPEPLREQARRVLEVLG